MCINRRLVLIIAQFALYCTERDNNLSVVRFSSTTFLWRIPGNLINIMAGKLLFREWQTARVLLLANYFSFLLFRSRFCSYAGIKNVFVILETWYSVLRYWPERPDFPLSIESLRHRSIICIKQMTSFYYFKVVVKREGSIKDYKKFFKLIVHSPSSCYSMLRINYAFNSYVILDLFTFLILFPFF